MDAAEMCRNMASSFLSDRASDQIAIGLKLLPTGSSQFQKPSLDRNIPFEVSIQVGEGKITKENCMFLVEEVLDLLSHIDKFLSRNEDQFEWSTVEPSVQMLQLSREAEVIHVQLLLKLYGYPEGYAGNASLSFQFNADENGVRRFQGGVTAQLLILLGDEKVLDALTRELEEKIRIIRGRRAT